MKLHRFFRCLRKFADGFAYQKGAIFGFGPKAGDDTGTVLKIADLDKEQLHNLDTGVPVHNIGQERSVDLFIYETGVRGKRNIDAVSRKMILNKSSNLIHDIC